MAANGRIDAGVQRFALIALAFSFIALIAWLNRPGADLQLNQQAGLPFGCIPSPRGGYAVQDFAYNLMYLRGIGDRVVPHPYRLADQEILIRRALPTAASGMCHAYSPVAYILAQPLLALPPRVAYIALTILAAIATLLLYGLDLLPRADRLQLYLLLICAVSVTEVTAFAEGQSSLLTTPLIAAMWWFVRRGQRGPWAVIALGFITWALCMKPSIALIPVTLLIGARAWSALGLTALLLAATWAVLGPLYGGWWNGLMDYRYLIGHYYMDAMTPFMRDVFTRHPDTGANAFFSNLLPADNALFFTLSRWLFLLTTALLLALRWVGRITPSQHFRGMIWNFLILCPYLLPSEDTIICLLIVEGDFFRSHGAWRNAALLPLVFGLMNLRAGLTFDGQINFPLKFILLGWMALEAMQARPMIVRGSPTHRR